ncbi:MAG: hypothetical protein MUF15_15360 [Acidobacteria bacterium]|nr:hypothetical protein [Acidobacteriota bacterium]
MAVKNCWQQKKLEGKEYFDRYRETIAIQKQKNEPGFKNNWDLVKKMTQYRVTLSRNWLTIIPCIIYEIICHFPSWFMALFRFCPKCKQHCADESFLIVGHRGAAAYEVENTIPSFQRALHNYGANALELDICLTKDGEVVVWHDWEPDNKVARARQMGLEPDVICKPLILSEEKKPVHRLTLAELRANYGYTKKKGKSKKLDVYIPTLREVMAWSQGQSKLRGLFIDVKTPPYMESLVPKMMKEITAIMDEFKPEFPVVFLSPEIEIIKAMKQANDQFNYSFDLDLPLGIVIDTDEYSCVRKAIDLNNNYASIGRPPILNLGPWTTYRMVIEYDTQLKDRYNLVSERPIEGLLAWTINRGSEMKCLIKMGVNGSFASYSPFSDNDYVRRNIINGGAWRAAILNL